MKNLLNLLLIFVSVFTLGFAGFQYGNNFAVKHDEIKFEITSITPKIGSKININETIEFKFSYPLKKQSITSNSIFTINSNQEKLISPQITHDDINNSIKINFDKKMFSNLKTAEIQIEITDSLLNIHDTKLNNPQKINYIIFQKPAETILKKRLTNNKTKVKNLKAKNQKSINNSQVSSIHQSKR